MRRALPPSPSPPTCPSYPKRAPGIGPPGGRRAAIDALFLRIWAGNRTFAGGLSRTHAPGTRRACAIRPQQGPCRSWTTTPFIPAWAAAAAGHSTRRAPPRPSREVAGGPGRTEQARARGFFTTIRRAPEGGFTLVPYAWSTRASSPRGRAAARGRHPDRAAHRSATSPPAPTRSSATTLRERRGLMELDRLAEPTLGPYEVYETSGSTGRRPSAFITVRDEARRAKWRASRPSCRSGGPSARRSRIATRSWGAPPPIRVVNVVFTAGDAKPRRATAASTCPTTSAWCARRLQARDLRNVQRASSTSS